MKFSLPDETNGEPCNDCTVRRFSICAALDKTELRELEHISHHAHFAARDDVRARGTSNIVLQSA